MNLGLVKCGRSQGLFLRLALFWVPPLMRFGNPQRALLQGLGPHPTVRLEHRTLALEINRSDLNYLVERVLDDADGAGGQQLGEKFADGLLADYSFHRYPFLAL